MSKKPEPQKTGMIQAPIMTEAAYFIHWVPADRWKEAVTFFETTIGLMLRNDTGEGWAEFSAGKITFALHATDELKPCDTGLCFAVDDCDEAVAALKARGVKIKSEPHKVSEQGRAFEWLDPFGYSFSGYGK